MRIVIAGAGEVGTHLAKMLSNEEQNIYLMDADAKKLERAAHHLEVLPVEGSPTLLEDLERAHVEVGQYHGLHARQARRGQAHHRAYQ